MNLPKNWILIGQFYFNISVTVLKCVCVVPFCDEVSKSGSLSRINHSGKLFHPKITLPKEIEARKVTRIAITFTPTPDLSCEQKQKPLIFVFHGILTRNKSITMSWVEAKPLMWTRAFGGVLIGSRKANEQAIVAGSRRNNGFAPIWTLRSAKTGSSRAHTTTFDVICVSVVAITSNMSNATAGDVAFRKSSCSAKMSPSPDSWISKWIVF